jgi:hypothetical protein
MDLHQHPLLLQQAGQSSSDSNPGLQVLCSSSGYQRPQRLAHYLSVALTCLCTPTYSSSSDSSSHNQLSQLQLHTSHRSCAGRQVRHSSRRSSSGSSSSSRCQVVAAPQVQLGALLLRSMLTMQLLGLQ